MKILKHGNNYDLGQISCPECECVFVYNGKDITEETWTDRSSYYPDECRRQVVFCPECCTKLSLDGSKI